MRINEIPVQLIALTSAAKNTKPNLEIHYHSIENLLLRDSNPRTHSPKQIRQIAESISKFGFTSPVLIDEQNSIIAGHGRVASAKTLNMVQVPTICLGQMTEAEIRAYVITDNRLAENAGWDEELLKLEFQYLSELDIDFELTITGFETAEIDLLIEPANDESDPIDDAPSADLKRDPIAQLGDSWILGSHRLLCGDATKPEYYDELMGNDRANLIFTDPPYNVPVKGHISGLGEIQHEEFVMASGEMSQEQFTDFLKLFIQNLINYSIDGSMHYICMDWRHLSELLNAAQAYSEHKNLCVWMKDNAGMGSLYRSQHELVLVFKNGTAPHINNVELGVHGRYRTNVWKYAGANSFHDSRMEELEMHPTVKPVAMIKDAILDCSNRGGIILDPFAGSGSTLIAADQCGRRAYVMELDPRYVDVILKRYWATTGNEPVHTESGMSFTEISLLRQVCAQDLVTSGDNSSPVIDSAIDEKEGSGDE